MQPYSENTGPSIGKFTHNQTYEYYLLTPIAGYISVNYKAIKQVEIFPLFFAVNTLETD